MSDIIQLTEAELDLVAGGQVGIGTFTATQSNSSSVTQSASATAMNSGAVTAVASGYRSDASATGAEAAAVNLADVDQRNSVSIRG